jgi:serine/threonine-protein kinase
MTSSSDDETPVVRAAAGAGTGGSRPPTDFLEASARRLGWFSLLLACPPLMLNVADGILLALGKPALTPNPGLAIVARAALTALSMAMFAIARSRRLSLDRVLLAGLGYEVAGALLLSLRSFWGAIPRLQVGENLTPVSLWIVLFPLVVPASPRRAAVAAFASALTGPLVHALWALRCGDAPESVLDLARSFFPLFVTAGVNVGGSWIVHGLGRKIAAAESKARELGSYRLVERLGNGGMGEVWRAEHRMLARPAAIKLIRPELLATEKASDRASIIARFEREAQATAELRSAHTVSLLDYGVSEDGTLYYVMELLQGLDLETLVERFGPLPSPRVVHLLSQASESLAEAHAHGLIHRDIKPANIYISRLGLETDVVKVLDFGLVGHARGTSGNAHLTGDGYIVGTPRFMAPEQAAGKPVDERADIYALGGVGYYLLTGTSPFLSEHPGELIADHLKTPVEPPSRRLGKPLPQKLESLLLRCLEKDPSQRPLDAWSFVQELQACGLEEWTASEARRWWDENLKELAGPKPRSSLTATTLLAPNGAAGTRQNNVISP